MALTQAAPATWGQTAVQTVSAATFDQVEPSQRGGYEERGALAEQDGAASS